MLCIMDLSSVKTNNLSVILFYFFSKSTRRQTTVSVTSMPEHRRHVCRRASWTIAFTAQTLNQFK